MLLIWTYLKYTTFGSCGWNQCPNSRFVVSFAIHWYMCGQKTQLYLKKIFYCYLFWQLQWENVSEKLMTVHYSLQEIILLYKPILQHIHYMMCVQEYFGPLPHISKNTNLMGCCLHFVQNKQVYMVFCKLMRETLL